jgi:hypothetical protein
MASQTLAQTEDGNLQFALPGGLILAEEASVAEHMASHSRAVEQAAAQAQAQAASSTQADTERRTGVPEDLLKSLPVMSFLDALAKECDKRDDQSEGNESGDNGEKALDCCKGKKIPGLQIDSDAEERACEICQSGYNDDEEVFALRPILDDILHLTQPNPS